MCKRTALAILAGGQGRRLGGRDKGLLPLADGSPLLRSLLNRLRQHPWEEVLVICRSEQAKHYRPLTATARLVFDHYGPGLGPMAALHAAFEATVCDWVQLWPVDAPTVCPQLLQALDQSVPPALIPEETAGRLQPLFGRYHANLSDDLACHLDQQRLSISRWLRDIDAPRLTWRDSRCFTNLNEPDDLALLAMPTD